MTTLQQSGWSFLNGDVVTKYQHLRPLPRACPQWVQCGYHCRCPGDTRFAAFSSPVLMSQYGCPQGETTLINYWRNGNLLQLFVFTCCTFQFVVCKDSDLNTAVESTARNAFVVCYWLIFTIPVGGNSAAGYSLGFQLTCH